MLYQDKTLGRLSIAARVAFLLQSMFSNKRQADLDLLSMNAHLRRDLGLENGGFSAGEIWRK